LLIGIENRKNYLIHRPADKLFHAAHVFFIFIISDSYIRRNTQNSYFENLIPG